MIPYAILGVLLGLPLVLGVAFRVNTSHVFFSLMAGELLAHYFGHDVGTIVHSVIRSDYILQYAVPALIVLPLVLTAIFLHGTVSKGKLVLHLIPLLITGVVLAAFVLPDLPAAAQSEVQTVEAGRQLLDLSSVIVGGVVFVQLVSLWLLNRAHEGGEGHHGKKKHHHVG
jgi:hypothetical protein